MKTAYKYKMDIEEIIESAKEELPTHAFEILLINIRMMLSDYEDELESWLWTI